MKKLFVWLYIPIPFLSKASQLRNSYIPRKANTLASIDLHCLISSGVRGIILDLDNTIISEDDRYLSPGAELWIKQAKQMRLKIFILSNGKRYSRVQYWSCRLDVPSISPAKKPFPFGFINAIQSMQLQPGKVVVIGDSLHTDIFGAWLVGCHGIQVASLPHPPRWWEKLLGKYVQIPYPKGLELWDFKIPDVHQYF
uniref:HAD superfamily (Subfamily IIIA) phosphatase, TIGR01668 n=1 Tax=Cyanothece sp. (strain PCC 7425 / ATCC 29141) TaxID=395961 RepID=B8HVA4_CYAP4